VSLRIYGCRPPAPPDRGRPGRFEDSAHPHGPAISFPLVDRDGSLAGMFRVPGHTSRGRALIGSVCQQPHNAYTYIAIK
jgi:hypothetical protein